MQQSPQFLFNEREAAKIIDFTPRALQEWRRRGGGPRFIKVSSRAIRYRLEDLQSWAAERVRSSTSDEG